MVRIIAVANQKGGVGKTTTVINLGASLAEAGKRVLVIDMDPQGNTTSGFGLDKDEIENSVYELILGECSIEECIVPNVYEKLSLIGANINLSGAEIELYGEQNKEYILRDEIAKVQDRFDFILIDCPPSLNLLTINAMTTADGIMVPIQCEYYALEGLSQLLRTVSLIQERLNDRLQVEGIVFTMYDSRNNLSEQVVQNVRGNLQENVFKTIIPRNVRLAEAPSFGLPINLYDSRSAGAESYRALAKEVISHSRALARKAKQEAKAAEEAAAGQEA